MTEWIQALVQWYREHQRSLPWRQSNDPYKIWVSEVMLQQTRVDTVIPYYENFINKFPTPHALASAKEEEVLKAWEGLGYYSRVRNLHTAVKEVSTEYSGEVPMDPEQFASLKGVGPYTKGAVMSIAYNLEEPAVDGNVMRVLSRVLYITDDIGKQKTRKRFESYVREYLQEAPPSEFNQALMELGALICKPKNPQCNRCPIESNCTARKKDEVSTLPVKAKKAKPKPQTVLCAIIVDENDRILIEKRPEDGLLAQLWQFPSVVHNSEEELYHYLKRTYDVDVNLQRQEQTFKHIFSHLIWNVTVYTAFTEQEKLPEKPNSRWVTKAEMQSFSFPVVYQKIWQYWLGFPAR